MKKGKILTGLGHELATDTPVNGDRIHWTLDNGAVIHISETAEGLRISTGAGKIIIQGVAANVVSVNDAAFVRI